jgi:hypothetical protein
MTYSEVAQGCTTMTEPSSVSLLFENDGLSGARQPSSSLGTHRARNRLRSKGLRVTRQRLVVLQILEETRGTWMSRPGDLGYDHHLGWN